jgi:hypothetical protein
MENKTGRTYKIIYKKGTSNTNACTSGRISGMVVENTEQP